jgi:hypothetical protein
MPIAFITFRMVFVLVGNIGDVSGSLFSITHVLVST